MNLLIGLIFHLNFLFFGQNKYKNSTNYLQILSEIFSHNFLNNFYNGFLLHCIFLTLNNHYPLLILCISAYNYMHK